MKFATPTGRRLRLREAGFTLAEVLAALFFMAIVIPVAVEALHIASVAGVTAQRKDEASRVAQSVLNENVLTGNAVQSTQGTIRQNGHEFKWRLRNELWPQDAMQLVTAEVTFSAGDRECAVRMSTLVNTQQQ